MVTSIEKFTATPAFWITGLKVTGVLKSSYCVNVFWVVLINEVPTCSNTSTSNITTISSDEVWILFNIWPSKPAIELSFSP